MEKGDGVDWTKYHGGLFDGPGIQTYSVSSPQNDNAAEAHYTSPMSNNYNAFPARQRKTSQNRSRSITPTRPESGHRPGSVTPTRPGSVTPTRPGSVTPTRPGSVTPGRPGSTTPTSNRSRPSTPKNRHNSSFVDETLFGTPPVEADFIAPWDDGKKPVFVMDATDFKMQQKLREQREKNTSTNAVKARSTPVVASHTILKGDNRTYSIGRPSLAGEYPGGYNSPQGKRSHSEPRQPSRSQSNDWDEMSARGSRPPSRTDRPSSRTESSRPTLRPSSATGKRTHKKQDKHQPSYVDELLFGQGPTEPDFPAPWEDLEAEKRRGRPFWYDGTDYRSGSNQNSGRPASREGQHGARARSAPRSHPSKPAPWR